jgi:hypothetical protein
MTWDSMCFRFSVTTNTFHGTGKISCLEIHLSCNDIQDVPGTNLGPETGYPDSLFPYTCNFYHIFEALPLDSNLVNISYVLAVLSGDILR